MLKAVLFDLDGTLLDTIPDIAGALNRALAVCGLPPHPVRAFEAFVGGGIREAVLKAAPADTDEATVERVLAVYHDAYVAHCTDNTTPYPGIRELLETLAEEGMILGVLSNKTEATAQKIIRHFFPEIPFRCVFGRAEGRPLKPHAGAAEPVLAALNVVPEEIVYVGDSGTDMTFAKAVGMIPVAAPWGYRSREELVSCGAGALPETSGEMLRQLLELRKVPTIRPYREEDWAAIEAIHDTARKQELALAGLTDAFVPLKEAAVSEGLFDYTVRVAEQVGRVVGFVAYTDEELAWLYVAPNQMRRGIGRSLVCYVLAHTERRPLALEVLSGNEPARLLYTSLGFETVETATGKMPGNESFTVTVHCMELA